MQRQARLPEIFDQIAQNTPVLEVGSEHPPPRKIEIWTDLGTLGFDGWSMWRLIAVSPKDTISLSLAVIRFGLHMLKEHSSSMLDM